MHKKSLFFEHLSSNFLYFEELIINLYNTTLTGITLLKALSQTRQNFCFCLTICIKGLLPHNLARLTTIRWFNQPLRFKHIDNTCRAIVANSKAPLQQRDRNFVDLP